MFCNIGKGSIGFGFSESEITCIMTDVSYEFNNINLDESKLTWEQKSELQRLISSFGDVLTRKLWRANCSPYEVKIKGNPKPVQIRPYQCTPLRMKALKSKISNMLKRKVIEPSKSQW